MKGQWKGRAIEERANEEGGPLGLRPIGRESQWAKKGPVRKDLTAQW